jgi:C-terminal processing protease CtpA/Prc
MYIPSMESAIAHGRRYSDGFPLTKPAWCNWHEQCYFGPVVLITDALSYSATDAFAAGFQDHAIGKILGVSPTTGAGGANVWRLDDFIDEAVEGLTRLPRLASLRVAFRRTRRVGTHAGDLVEEVGVVPDFFHQTTRDDLLHEDRDLLAHAAAILARL